MATKPETRLNLEEGELNSLVRAVKPKLIQFQTNISGSNRSRVVISGTHNFAGFRVYSQGDEVRSINWKASARCSQYQVHQQQQEKNGRWFICIDASASMGLPDSGKWSLVRELAGAMAYLLTVCGNQVGMIVFSDKVDHYCKPGTGKSQYKKLHNKLVELSPQGSGGKSLLYCCVPYINGPASLFVISDFLPHDTMKNDLDALRKTNCPIHALRIVSSYETLLPENGLLNVIDIESGESRTIDSSVYTQQQADAILRRQNADLKTYCREHRLKFSYADTNLTWKSILLSHFLGN